MHELLQLLRGSTSWWAIDLPDEGNAADRTTGMDLHTCRIRIHRITHKDIHKYMEHMHVRTLGHVRLYSMQVTVTNENTLLHTNSTSRTMYIRIYVHTYCMYIRTYTYVRTYYALAMITKFCDISPIKPTIRTYIQWNLYSPASTGE